MWSYAWRGWDVAVVTWACGTILLWNVVAVGEGPSGTSLTDASVAYRVADRPYVTLRRGPVEAVIVNNEAVDDGVLVGHRAGYSGVACLRHTERPENLFVPAYAGLNFEHILDGTGHADRRVLYEPRNWPMELRIVSSHVVELYQSPTPTYGLETCQRYELLDDGTIQLTVDIIPRKKAFRYGYIGLFWASYIHQPSSLDIHFRGWPEEVVPPDKQEPLPAAQWIRGVSPAHGVHSTHRSYRDHRLFNHGQPFPLTLVFHYSPYRYAEPWYFGISHGMAFLLVFRSQDLVRLTQSPSGGGQGNPAWDFQYFIPQYEVGTCYRFVMRAIYMPFHSAEQIQSVAKRHVEELDRK